MQGLLKTASEELRRVRETLQTFEVESKKRKAHIKELKTELEIKEIEIKYLNLGLQEANKERYELRRKFSETRDSLKISETQLCLSNKKRKMIHEEMDNKRDMMINDHVMYQSATIELKAVKELLQKSQLKERELSRELEICQTRYKRDSLTEKQLEEKEDNITYDAEILRRGLNELKKEQFHIAELKNDSELVKKFMDTLVLSVENYNTLKKDTDFYKKQFHEVKMQHNNLLHLIESITHDLKSTPPMQQVLKQWTDDIKEFREANKKNCDMLSHSISDLAREKTVNQLLILRIEGLEKMLAAAKANINVETQMDNIHENLSVGDASKLEKPTVLGQNDESDLESQNDERKDLEELLWEARTIRDNLELDEICAVLGRRNSIDLGNETGISELLNQIDVEDISLHSVANIIDVFQQETALAANDSKSNKEVNETNNDTDNANEPKEATNVLENDEATKDPISNDESMDAINPDDTKLVEICKAFENVNVVLNDELLKSFGNKTANSNKP